MRLAAPAGVDLVAAARVGAPPRKREVAVKVRRWGRQTVLLQPPQNRARGSSSNSIERPTWTLSELGQAAAGVPDIAFRAACYAWAGDTSQLWPLHRALSIEARHLRQRFRWPELTTDLHGCKALYLENLAKLVLDEDRSPNSFRTAPGLFALYMFTTEEVWDKTLCERFEALKLSWLDWLGVAARIMQPRLRENDDTDD